MQAHLASDINTVHVASMVDLLVFNVPGFAHCLISGFIYALSNIFLCNMFTCNMFRFY